MDERGIWKFEKNWRGKLKKQTWRPIRVLPVNEMSGKLGSSAMAWPTSAPAQTKLQMAPGSWLRSSTWATIFDVAMLHRGVDGAPFHIIVLPQICGKWKEWNFLNCIWIVLRQLFWKGKWSLTEIQIRDWKYQRKLNEFG